MKKKSIYLAGPITGQDYNGATDWRERLTTYFKKKGIICYSPMRGKAYLEKETDIKDSYDEHRLSTLDWITTRDRDDVKNSGLVIFNFLGVDEKSIGSCIEIGWADAYRIPMIVIMEENCVHWHGMIRHLGLIVDNIEDAMFLACQMLLEG